MGQGRPPRKNTERPDLSTSTTGAHQRLFGKGAKMEQVDSYRPLGDTPDEQAMAHRPTASVGYKRDITLPREPRAAARKSTRSLRGGR